MSTKRNRSMDIAKAIGIILVVLGHSNSPVTKIIYLFHMALFFFISGYFYKDNYTKEPIKFIKKKILGLYVPFVSFSVIFILFHNLFIYLQFYNSIFAGASREYEVLNKSFNILDTIKNIIKVLFLGQTDRLLGGALWFLVALLIASIFFNIISYLILKLNIKHEILRGGVVLLCFIIAYLSTHLKFNFHGLNTAIIAMGIFYLGYLYHNYSIKLKIKLKLSYSIGAFILLIILSNFGSINMASNHYTNIIYFIGNSILGIYLTLYLSNLIANKFNKIYLLDYIGKNTIYILGLHFLSFKLIDIIKISIYQYPSYMIGKFPVIDGSNGWYIIYTISGVILPLGVKFVYDKLKRLYHTFKYSRFCRGKCIPKNNF